MANGPFEVVGPKLNVFALANGMDLAKDDPGRRVLSWYREGLERGIVIEADASGALAIAAAAWKTNDEASRVSAPVRDGMSDEELANSLGTVLEAAMEAANKL